jgi:protein-disulfide isomerase
MSKKTKKTSTSKRQAFKEERRRKERQRRILTIVAIIGTALVLIGLIMAPSIQAALAPVGDYVQITPQDWPLADGTAIGDPNAPVLVEVFEDFTCSACKNYTENIEPLVITNHAAVGEIYYVFYNYPFLDDNSPIKDSDRAAIASMCAAEQNRFWDYHRILYANLNHTANEFNEKRLAAFAEELDLDMGEFNNCVKTKDVQDEINKDLAKGKEIGITGTPSVLVNGVIIKPGAQRHLLEVSESEISLIAKNADFHPFLFSAVR